MMTQEYSPQHRAERLIATGRVVLATFSLLAIRLDPSEPAKYAAIAYALLSAYVVYALLLAVWVWRLRAPLVQLGFVTHALDLTSFSLFMYFTEGPTSPFFVYFIFALVCATLRWQWRGTLWTAVVALAMFIGMGVYTAEVLRDPEFELNRFIIRSVYLAVAAILLGYLGAYEERLRGDMSRLASWPRTAPHEARELVQEVLEQAAHVIEAPRAVIAWEEPEEPWLNVASWSRGEFLWTREPPTAFQPPVADVLADSDFLCPDAEEPAATVLYTSFANFEHYRGGAPIHPGLRDRFSMRAVLSVNLRGETFAGRLFILDKPGMTSDDLVLGRAVARQISVGLDRFYLLQRLQQAAAAEERVRLARDLHDGLLQSLTGIALQLQTVRSLLEQDPQAARDHLRQVQHLIADQQTGLRSFIQQLKPAPLGTLEVGAGLVARLEDLRERIETQWGVRIELKVEPLNVRIPGALASEIYLIVHEALVNAARHAEASSVQVDLGPQDNRVRITVTDDGRGFPFRGHYDLASLTAMKLGPVTLSERIASLGGSLGIDSTDSGARLEISLPLATPGA